MIGALWILLFIIVLGIVLWGYDVFFWKPRHRGLSETSAQREIPETTAETQAADSAGQPGERGGICCGMHAVCEKTSLTPFGDEAEYYDDEELDRFRGRTSESYTPEEVEEFRDVMMTMRPEEVAGWARSLQIRAVELPSDVREELLMIVSELRNSVKTT